MKLVDTVVVTTGAISIIFVILGGFIYELETKVATLEGDIAKLQSKTWHTVTNFDITKERASQSFFVPGNRWRIKWTFTEEGVSIHIDKWHGFRVLATWTMEMVDGLELYWNMAKGVLYLDEGQRYYQVVVSGIEGSFAISFVIESYH